MANSNFLLEEEIMLMDGKYTQKELNYLINRLKNLEAQGRAAQGAKEEIANLKYEIQWAKNHLK